LYNRGSINSPSKIPCQKNRYKQTAKFPSDYLVVELDKFSLIEEIGFQTRVEEYSNLDDVWGVHSHLLPNELVLAPKTH
jgi:hypothetical protein